MVFQTLSLFPQNQHRNQVASFGVKHIPFPPLLFLQLEMDLSMFVATPVPYFLLASANGPITAIVPDFLKAILAFHFK
jgi:hypothetical protein